MTQTSRNEGLIHPEEFVRDLSDETLSYFFGLYADNFKDRSGWSTGKDVAWGKFIRLGSVITLGASIPFARTGEQGKKSRLLHSDISKIVLARMTEEDHAARQAEVGGRVTLDGTYMLDAGQYTLVGAGTDTRGILLTDESTAFGRADTLGRVETNDIARDILDSSTSVLYEE